MTKILVPENVNPFNITTDLFNFIESCGLEIMGDPEEVFQYLDEFTQQQWLDRGMKVFLIINTYDRHPGKKFVVGYDVDYLKDKKPIKTYIVHEFKHL